MVSITPGYPAQDFQQMYNFQDLRNLSGKKCKIKDNSLTGILNTIPDFSIFAEIVDKARLTGILSDIQSNYTLFVPSNSYLKKKYSKEYIDNIDIGLARRLVNFSMMNRVIDKSLLQSSPVSIFPTIDRSNSMKIDTISGTTRLPNCVSVIHWNHPADNGLIHVVDGLLVTF